MGRGLLRAIQVMNAVSVVLFVVFCIHSLSCHSNAQHSDGAIAVVATEENDNGEATVEVEASDETTADERKHEESGDEFYPTDEWQTVKEGQAIPAGLHVRMSMKTGEKEAKLMDGDSGIKYLKSGQNQAGMVHPEKKYFSQEELKRALKDFKMSKLDETDLKREEDIQSKYRSYSDLKQDFESMNIGIKTDGEIVSDLLEKLKQGDITVLQKLQVLAELEYYLHQIDNAVLFKDMGGLPWIIKAVNDTDDERIQKEAAMVLGAATQSNPKVQIGAVEANALQVLLRLLSSTSKSSVELKRKILFAISSLCRHFPYAQKKLLELGGLSAMGELFQDPEAEKLQLKAVTLFHDLIVEKENAEHSFEKDSSLTEKLRQYQLVRLREAMVEQGWCELIPKLLNSPEHDSREKVLNAMNTLNNVCSSVFKRFEPKLNELRQEYIVLSKEETSEDDRYFTLILQSVDKMISLIGQRDEL